MTKMERKDVSVVVVEDAASTLPILSLYLEQAGFTVTSVKGTAGLKRVAGSIEEPNLVLFDVLVSESDCQSLTSSLKSNKLISDIPVMVVSPSSSCENKLVEAGVDHFITKPFKKNKVIRSIEAIAKNPQKTTEKDLVSF